GRRSPTSRPARSPPRRTRASGPWRCLRPPRSPWSRVTSCRRARRKTPHRTSRETSGRALCPCGHIPSCPTEIRRASDPSRTAGRNSIMTPTVGAVLAGKYRVERVLGRGGMGVVLEAVHLQLEQPVAIKFLLPEAAALEGASARFLREARAAARI